MTLRPYYPVVPAVVGTTSSCDMTNLRLQVDGADMKGSVVFVIF